MIILWTDALVYLLLICAIIFAMWAHKQPHLKRSWQYLRKSKIAIVAGLILVCYLTIGLLDSIHFKVPANESGVNVESVFDYLVTPLGKDTEKTYSAPFSTHLYTKEFFVSSNGQQNWVYPTLKFGHPVTNIWMLILNTSVISALIFLGIVTVLFLILRKKFSPNIPWTTIIITIGVLLLIGANLFVLSQHYHILGTDKIGQDMFYETLKSVRTGLIIGILTTLITIPFAIFFGMLAGYFGGKVDDLIQYLYTTLSSIPDVLLIAAAILALQIFMLNHPSLFPDIIQRADIRLLMLCVILGITSWTGLCRLLRGETLKLRELDYIQAAKALGSGHTRILVRHIFPNLMYLVLIAFVMDFSGLVLAEAVLTYVGVGVDPSTISWGNIINTGRLELAREPVVWWPLLAAFILMFPLVICANFFADVVRDAMDPKLSQG